MPIELLGDENYELEHPSGAVFILKEWTLGMQNETDRQCFVQDGKGGMQYLVERARELKVTLSLADWRGVRIKGADAPCTAENKKKLPVSVIVWLVNKIDEHAGLNITDAEKKS